MHFSSLVMVTLCAFAAGISATPQKLYTIITSKQYGLNLTLNSDRGIIGFEKDSPFRYWVDYPVSQGAHNWHCFRAKQKYTFDVVWWIRFQDYVSGKSATAPLNYAYPPSLFEVETVGDTSYFIAIESLGRAEKLACTIGQDNNTAVFSLKLRPYKRLPSQEFRITQELGEGE
ncbi:hypothetical protein MaudCBS49596_005293 [Microsporum audouinii]